MAKKNADLHAAKNAKNDEFYTQLSDIEREISQHEDYVRQFEGKVVFCNCDDPEHSAFFEFFKLHFQQLKLKKVIATHYNKDGSPSYKIEWSGETLNGDMVNLIKTPLDGNGDFRSEECVQILQESDIVVTNPPFSLFRQFIAQLMEYEKKFIIIGNMNAITYKEFFPLLKENKVWAGYGFNLSMVYKTPYPNKLEANRKYVKSKGYDPDKGYVKVPAICWFTNLDIDKRHEDLPLNRRYQGNEDEYPKYDNYDAINIDKVSDIPRDYYECIGVPITFLDKYNPEQFEIVRFRKGNDDKDLVYIRPTSSQSVNVERERTRPAVLPNHHSTQTSCSECLNRNTDMAATRRNTVAESSECQLRSWTNITQNNSESSGSIDTLQITRDTDTDSLLIIERPMQESLFNAESVINILLNQYGYSREEIEYCSGVMGVPITFLNSYHPNQFYILGMASSAGYHQDIVGIDFLGDKDARPLINSKNTFARIFIRKKDKKDAS